ncbi:MAG: 23S rRNA (pseudouridine(1915)-N(3))-methyltransferase RlmH [Erysipelotrichaceae bacterium]|nr:23S rRNA (pseudouridine(1915)-N(3))-methyltransferase RlmH [Erysipelotrichaceae bacterium]
MIKVVAVGKIKEKALSALIAEYQKRLSGYVKLTIVEVNDEEIVNSEVEALKQRVLTLEATRILNQIKEKEYVILLDLKGEMVDSITLAKKIDSVFTYQTGDITFVIGGSLGVSEEVIKRANWRLKLSDLTFTHQHARLLVLEQLYRCFKINNNETYHK